jgi:hypothetical protein
MRLKKMTKLDLLESKKCCDEYGHDLVEIALKGYGTNVEGFDVSVHKVVDGLYSGNFLGTSTACTECQQLFFITQEQIEKE